MIALVNTEFWHGDRRHWIIKWPFIFLIVFLLKPIRSELYLSSGPIQTEKRQQTIQHEVEVTLKLVQVYVTDKKGNPVLDLKKEDFTILDNGKKQAVTEFEKHILSLPFAKTEIQPEIIQETKIPPPRELLNRKFFLLFDFAYNNAKGILKAKQAALHFIDTQLTRPDEVGVISYSALKSLVLHEYLTADHRIARKVVESFGLKNSAGRAENLEVQYWQDITGVSPLDASKRGGVFSKEQEIDQLQLFSRPKRKELELSPEDKKFLALAGTRMHALNFIQKMKELANALSYIPGYKHIILFSSGLPYSLAYGIQSPFGKIEFEGSWGDSLLRQRYEEMLKELASSNCTLYTLDTEDSATKIAEDIRTRGVFSLQKMANATGGKYFGNINNYEKHLEKIQNLTSFYYVLGYYIDERWDGKYHEIKVEVTRPGCEVHAQRGYFNHKPFTEYSNLEKMLHLVDLALAEKPLFQTPVSFPLVALPCSIKGKPNLALYSSISVEKIQEIQGKKAEILSIIFDNENNIVKIERDEIEFSKLPRGDFYYSSSISLPPGEYKCRLVLRNLETGKGAVASASVIISKDLGYGIKLYPPLLLKAETGAFYIKEPSPLYPFDKTRYSPLFKELEEGTKNLLAMVRCSFFGIQQPDIKLSANLIHHLTDSSQKIPVTLYILDRYAQVDTRIFLIELQTEGLRSGEYFLYVFAEETNTKSSYWTNNTFKVK